MCKFNLLCCSKNCSIKELWLADSYATGVDGTTTNNNYCPAIDQAKLTSFLTTCKQAQALFGLFYHFFIEQNGPIVNKMLVEVNRTGERN